MGHDGLTFRPYVAADRDAVVELLVRAFAEDPAWVHAFGDRTREGLAFVLPRLMGMRLEAGGTAEIALLDGRIAGVAVWDVGGTSFGRWTYVRWGLLTMPVRFGLPTVRRMLAADDEVGALKRLATPDGPHLIGIQLAVDPDLQGRGVGSALLGRFVAAADARGVPALLMTTLAANVRYYERAGFVVRAQDGIAKSFTAWAMIKGPPAG